MRLVNADYLLTAFPEDESEPLRISVIRAIIKMCPTVEAVPAVHGRWKMVEGELAFWDMCSACGRKIVHRTPYYDFCPNCGARMDGKDGDT